MESIPEEASIEDEEDDEKVKDDEKVEEDDKVDEDEKVDGNEKADQEEKNYEMEEVENERKFSGLIISYHLQNVTPFFRHDLVFSSRGCKVEG